MILCKSPLGGLCEMKRRTILLSLGAALVAPPSFAASALSEIDTDHDGTIDLAEAKAAASAVFDRLDGDHDGTLDAKELKGRVARADWPAADPDHDGTVTKDEYLAFVERAFKRADPDNDGTIDAKELRTKAGQVLLRLFR